MAGLILAFVSGGLFATICIGVLLLVEARGDSILGSIEAGARRVLRLPPMRAGAWREE